MRRLATWCLTGLLAWGGGAPALHAETTVQFWHSMTGHLGEVLGQLAGRFNAAPANQGKIKVELQFIGTYEEGLNKLRTALLAHRAPHIVQITDIGTQVLVDARATVPLQDLIKDDPTFPLDQLLPQVRRYYEVGGKLQALPFATSNPIVYYNADAFAKAGIKAPPATFSELYAVAKRLTDPATKTTGLTWPLHSWIFEQFLAVQAQTLVDHDNGRAGRAAKALYGSPAGVAFVSLWAKMVKEGVFANVGRGWEPAEQNFLAGRSAMFITSTSDVFEIAKKAPFKVRTAPLPRPDAGAHGGTIIGGNALWILAGHPTAETEAAYEVIKFMASEAAQRLWHTSTGYFPIRSDVIAALEREGFYAKNPLARTAIDQLRASPDIPATRGALMGVFPQARVHVESAIELVLAGQAEPAAALAKAEAQTNAALARYNRGRP